MSLPYDRPNSRRRICSARYEAEARERAPWIILRTIGLLLCRFFVILSALAMVCAQNDTDGIFWGSFASFFLFVVLVYLLSPRVPR